MVKPIRVALFGCGRMGRNHERVIRESQAFKLVATIDPVAAGATHRTLASAPDFDAAIVATPTPTHFETAKLLIQCGKHVLVEKPIADTAALAKELSQVAHTHLDRLVIGHVERFNTAVRKLAEIVSNGVIGTPIHFSVTRVGGYPQHVTLGNNVTLDLAVHDLDILRTMLGPLRVLSSVAHCTVERGIVDTAEILLSSESGASATVHTNWITPTKIRSWRVTGTRGVAFVDLINQTCAVASDNDSKDYAIKRVEPLAEQLAAFGRFVATGDMGDLCPPDEAAAAVGLAERAIAGLDLKGDRAPSETITLAQVPERHG